MTTGKKFKIWLLVVILIIILVPVTSIVQTHRRADTAIGLIDTNCTEIRYYPTLQKMFVKKNNEARTEFTISMNGGSFGILKGQLVKEGWIFNRPRGDPTGGLDINQFHWRGIRTKAKPDI